MPDLCVTESSISRERGRTTEVTTGISTAEPGPGRADAAGPRHGTSNPHPQALFTRGGAGCQGKGGIRPILLNMLCISKTLY